MREKIKSWLLSILIILLLLIILGFIMPLVGRPIHKEKKDWFIRVSTLAYYKNRFCEYTNKDHDIDKFKVFLKENALIYPNTSQGKREFIEFYGSMSPLEIFSVIRFCDNGVLRWGILEKNIFVKNSNIICIMDDDTLYSIQKIGNLKDAPSLLFNILK